MYLLGMFICANLGQHLLTVYNAESNTGFSFGVFGYNGTASHLGYHFPITYVHC